MKREWVCEVRVFGGLDEGEWVCEMMCVCVFTEIGRVMIRLAGRMLCDTTMRGR